MRTDGAKAYCVAVTIRGNDFKNKSHQKKLLVPTDITSEIFEISKSLFTELWDKHTPLRLLGIALTDVSKDGYEQVTLFLDEERERARKMDKAIDSIRNKFGMDAIARGSSVQSVEVGKKYKAQMENKNEPEK